jgi:hypothetical protein
MPKVRFNTISTELVEHAEVAYDYFRNLGYAIKVEPYELPYPTRPALVCKSNHTQTVVLVCGRIEMEQLEAWVSLAKSLNTDFRVVICIPSESTQKYLPKLQLKIQQLGIGIFVSSSGQIARLSDPIDQNIRVDLPALKTLPRSVRKVLAPAYEHFIGGRWRDCFEEACKAFEQEVRPYFKQAIANGRLTVFDANGMPRNPTQERIEKMTLGQLAYALNNARPQNTTDSQIEKALFQINDDRVGLVHKNQQAKTEKRLRKNVGVHMHVMIQAVKELKK